MANKWMMMMEGRYLSRPTNIITNRCLSSVIGFVLLGVVRSHAHGANVQDFFQVKFSLKMSMTI